MYSKIVLFVIVSYVWKMVAGSGIGDNVPGAGIGDDDNDNIEAFQDNDNIEARYLSDLANRASLTIDPVEKCTLVRSEVQEQCAEVLEQLARNPPKYNHREIVENIIAAFKSGQVEACHFITIKENVISGKFNALKREKLVEIDNLISKIPVNNQNYFVKQVGDACYAFNGDQDSIPFFEVLSNIENAVLALIPSNQSEREESSSSWQR